MTLKSSQGSGDYRAVLFDAYADRVDMLDPERTVKVRWFEEYVVDAYGPQVEALPAALPILDVGCSRGYLLEALRGRGFRNLSGVDISARDIELAREHVPDASFTASAAAEFLDAHPRTFGLIILRAVLEHTPKGDVLALLRSVADALADDGTAIVDVPNMDWLFAGHERYMDFTHEVGFTRESLRQVMGIHFTSVEVRAVDHLSARERRSWRTRLGRAALGRLLRWADAQGADNPIWARNLVAVGRKTQA